MLDRSLEAARGRTSEHTSRMPFMPSVGRVEVTDKYVDIGTNLFSGGRTLLHALMIIAHVGNVMVCLQDLTFNVELAPTGLVERIEALSQAFFQKGTGEGGRPTEEHQS